MECQEIREQLSSFLDEEVELAERWRVERHLRGCAACRAELSGLGEVGRRLKAADDHAHGAAGGNARGVADGDGCGPRAAVATEARTFREATLQAAREAVAQRGRGSAAWRRAMPWVVPLAAGLVLAAAWGFLGRAGAGRGTPNDPAAGIADASGVRKAAPAAQAAQPQRPPSTLARYAELLAHVDTRDAAGNHKLGVWCEEQGLHAQAEERFRHVLALDPDDYATRTRLGDVRVKGAWLPRAEAVARGFVEYKGRWVLHEERANLEKGLRFYQGEWRTPEQILTAKGFVCDDGLWVTPDEREALARERAAAARSRAETEDVIVRTAASGSAPDAIRALDGVVVGAPLAYRRLAVYPLFTAGDPRSRVITLSEAARAGEVEVRDDAGVTIENRGERPILVPSGQMLIGGDQDRVSYRDLVLAPKERATLPVFCCERGRSSGPTPVFHGFDCLAPLPIRRLLARAGQGRVWSEVDAFLSRAQAQPRTSCLRGAYEQPALATRIRECQAALADLGAGAGDAAGAGEDAAGTAGARRSCLGLVAVVGHQIVSIDIFGGRRLFDDSYPRLLASLAADALLDEGPAVAAPSRRYVRSFVERLGYANYAPVEPAPASLEDALRREAAATNPTAAGNAGGAPEPSAKQKRQSAQTLQADFGADERIEGQALVYDGETVHVSVFATTPD
ncbi:MAG: zf-HC2 domain-containing protein [Planctomycetes bacterium]|nr:zf-HC2 domain-containing protein [Planctomycetota bacterium]